jgi:hypothetical protein
LKSGRAESSASAGIELYAFASSQRSVASEARAARQIVKKAKARGEISEDALVEMKTLAKLGVKRSKAVALARSSQQFARQTQRITSDAKLLQGFGNNGGEEYLSYMMTSESLVLAGGKEWKDWRSKIGERLEKIQSPDGSYTGHHCITSPVFCTAAVVQCITADRDAELLKKISEKDEAAAVE